MGQSGNDDLQILNDITQKINLGRSVEEVFDLLYDRLHPRIPIDRVSIGLLDDAGETLRVVAVRSEDHSPGSKGRTIPVAGSGLEGTLRAGRAVVVNDLDRRLDEGGAATRRMVADGFRSSLTLPLLLAGRPIGVMFFLSRTPDAYLPHHEDFLHNLSGHLAIAVEKSRLMEALKEKTRYLENILKSSADAIFIADEQDRIVSWNDGATRMFGYTAAEICGRTIDVLVPQDVLASGELDRLKEMRTRDGYVKDHECVRRARDGRRLTVDVTYTQLLDADGRPAGFSCILRDVSGLKKLEEDLVRSQSLASLGELAAMVAHEIKNPLAGISGAVQVLADAIPAVDSRRAVVGEILNQIERLDRIVRDLLAFARPTSPVRRTIDLGEVLWHGWSRVSQHADVSRVRFILDAGGRTTLSADPDLLHELWVNLYQNAVEAMPAGGELRVRVNDGERVRIEVADTGTGLDPGQVDELFQPFHTTKPRGTGLGLPISRKIVEAHGGSIRIESARGRGTTIIVELPRA